MGAEIISLNEAMRLTRANTLRSSAYLQKASTLGGLLRRRLNLLEERLFASQAGLEACRTGQLHKPECCFDAPEGRIWWFFSQAKHRFVLLDFDFATGGNGGLPVPDPWDDGVSRRCNCISRAGTARRVAARSSRLTPKLRADTTASADSFVADVLRSMKMVWGRNIGDGLRRGGPFSNVWDIGYAAHPAILEGLNSGVDWLPKWSILSDLTRAPEQIDNTFAQRILAGEAICRSIENRCYESPELRLAVVDAPRDDLLRDTVCALEFLFDASGVHKINLQRFAIARCVSGTPLADDWLMVMARSELTAHLSWHVVRAVKDVVSSVEGRDDDNWLCKARIIMKHYASLGEFAFLTEGLFSAGYPKVDARLFLDGQPSSVKSKLDVKTLRAVGKFDLVIHQIATGFSSWIEHQDVRELPQLHTRLQGLTEELLDSPE